MLLVPLLLQIQRLEWAFKQGEIPPDALQQNQEQLALLRAEREAVKERHSTLLREHHEAFHPIWGQLLKTGYQNSRYGHQIDRFACLYTSHVSGVPVPLKQCLSDRLVTSGLAI